MKIIRKKTNPDQFDPIYVGKKKYDFRLADFEIAEGDLLVLEEWDPDKKEYTGRSIAKRVGFIGKFTTDMFNQREAIEKNGFYIISLE